MQKFKIETLILPLQAQMLRHTLATMPGVTTVDIDPKRRMLQIDGKYMLYEIINASARQGITITPL